LIAKFEKFQEDLDAVSVLAMLDPASNDSEKRSFNNLIGEDTGSPRLYKSLETNYKLIEYKATLNENKSTTEDTSTKSLICNYNIDESRSYYGGVLKPEWLAPIQETKIMILSKENDAWKILSYSGYLGGTIDIKYSGFIDSLQK